MSVSSKLAGCLFVCLLTACGDETTSGLQPASAGHDGRCLARLELTPLGEVAPTTAIDRQTQSWLKLGREEALEGWELNGAVLRPIEHEGRMIRALHRKQNSKIEIPASISFRDTPQITLDIVVRNQGYTIRGELMDGGQVVSAAKLQVVKSKHFQSLKMTFPAVTGEVLNCDRIVLHVPKGDQPLGIDAVSIEDIALGGLLPPDAFGGLTLVEIGSDARLGTCISTEAGVTTKFTVDDNDQELVFSYVLPRSVVRGGEQPLLIASLLSDGEELVSLRLPFEGGLEKAPVWREQSLQVSSETGAEIEARFELESPDGSRRLAVLGQPQLVKRVEQPATVLLITSDTHRSDHVGFLAGENGPQTEWIDRLAEEGVAFLDATSSINNTTPSHVALFTGLNPRDTGIVTNATRLADAAPTLAEHFAELGYATLAAVSAAPVCSQFSGLGQGFDRYSNPGYRSARDSVETLAQLTSWLDDYEGRPLFVWLHVYDAHAPYDPPEEYIHRYYPDWMKPRDPASPVADFDLAPDWDTSIADPVFTESAYMAEVTYVDDRLAELLSRERFWNGTIAFTADHGETLRNGGENRFTHRGLTHSNLAIPMIFKAPSLEAGEHRAAPVQQIDVGRTLLDLAGHFDVEFPGRNVFEAPEDPETPRFAMQANGFSASVLVGKWMLSLGLRPAPSSQSDERDWMHRAELFDIEADESCLNDLSEEQPELTRKMRRQLVTWLESSQRNQWQTAAQGSPEDIQRKLNELGYASMETSSESESWIQANCDCEQCARFD